MSIEDTIGYVNDQTPVCDVCGKGLSPCEPFARVQFAERRIVVCCPLCLEVFQKDPAPYLARLQKIERYRALKAVTKKSTSP